MKPGERKELNIALGLRPEGFYGPKVSKEFVQREKARQDEFRE